MKGNIFLSFIVFILFNSYGITVQILDTLDKSNSGEIASIFDGGAFFSSPLPLYILQFLIITIFVSTVFIISQAKFSNVFSYYAKNHIKNNKNSRILWLIIANSSLLTLNAAYFKHSEHLTSFFRQWPENHLNIYLCWAIILIPILHSTWKSLGSRSIQLALSFTVVLLATFKLTSEPNSVKHATNTDKPNIIIIGIDSLRSDIFQTQMPFLTNQLKEATLFESAFTPLGRTFPAWNTILSGLYPVNHGARINLISNENLISRERYLPAIIKEEGYRSIFAIDETRFANIGEHQGFEQTITPRTGASDFLISSIADYPLVNLLSLAPISRWLLPEIYANRGAAKTYRSAAFSNIIARDLPIADQPTLLAVHFCLAHWPYYFSTPISPSRNYPEPYYPANLKAADQQIASLFSSLKKKGYLENSRIIFLSDHGEAWTHESPSFINTKTEERYSVKEYGHGSSLTSNSNQVLLAFKNFNNQVNDNQKKMASLADIVPTVLSEMGLKTSHQFDGVALNSTDMPDERIIPIETGTILQVDDSNKLNIDAIVKSFLDRYQLNRSGLLTIRQDKIEEGLKAKQYGLRNLNIILQKDEGHQFSLFNKMNNTYSEYSGLGALKANHKNWFKAWCHYYEKENPSCDHQ